MILFTLSHLEVPEVKSFYAQPIPSVYFPRVNIRIRFYFRHSLLGPVPKGPPRELLIEGPFLPPGGVCRPKGYGFGAVLV